MADDHPQPARSEVRHDEIARQNDWLRANLTSPGANRVVMTQGIAALIGDIALFRGFRKRAELLRTVRAFDTFDRDNDPYGHRDLGTFDFEGTRCLWKIDYYDTELVFGSEDPADPFKTVRILTILRADEWCRDLPRRSRVGARLGAHIGMLATEQLDRLLNHRPLLGRRSGDLKVPVAAGIEHDRQNLDRADQALPRRRPRTGRPGDHCHQRRTELSGRRYIHGSPGLLSSLYCTVIDADPL